MSRLPKQISTQADRLWGNRKTKEPTHVESTNGATNGSTGRKRAKQAPLPHTTNPKDKHLVRLAEKYVEKRDARMAAGREELVAKSALVNALKEKGLSRYEDVDDDIVILLLAGKEKLKVKPLSEADEDDDEAETGDRKSAAAGERED